MELHNKLQSHVSISQNTTQQPSTRPKLQRQSTIIQHNEDTHVSPDDLGNYGNHSDVDISDFEEPDASTLEKVATQWASNMSNEQYGRPSWATERAFHRTSPALRL